MSIPEHLPSQILRQLLIDESIGTDSGDWSTYENLLPDGVGVPVNAIALMDNAGTDDGRTSDGNRIEHPGIQVLVRSTDYDEGYSKLRAIGNLFDTLSYSSVTVASTNYVVEAITRTGNLLTLGEEEDSQNQLFSLNARVTIS